MKAIIYAGIGLFSIASVYGVADYYNSKKNGELKKLVMRIIIKFNYTHLVKITFRISSRQGSHKLAKQAPARRPT